MNNNDILRRLRYIFDFSDSKVIAIFAAADVEVSRAEISDWLKKDDDAAQINCSDKILGSFLNGYINERRGKRDDVALLPDVELNNNKIFMKLKIALNLKSDDVIEILKLADFQISKHELSAFFRKVGHKHYRDCKDQILRLFLKGLQLKYRGSVESSNGFKWKAT